MLEKRPYAIALIILVAFAAYANTLFAPFMWDDKVLVLNNAAIKEGWKSVATAFSPELWGLRTDNEAFQRYYRPLHTLLSIIDYEIWGLNPFGYHLTNTVLHIIDSVLVYFFALRVARDNAASLIAGAVFAAHPIHTEAVTFISARVDLLSCLFLLVSFLLYMASAKGLKLRLSLYVLSLFSFLLALLSKEMALTLPLLISIYAFMFEERGGRLKRALPFFAVLIGYIVFRVFALSSFLTSHQVQAPPVTLLLTASTAVFDYIRLLFIPYPLKAYYAIEWHSSLSLKVLASLVLLLASALTIALLYMKGRRTMAYGIIWTYLSIAPVLNIGALGEYSIAERYAYIPSIGFSIFFGLVLVEAARPRAYRYLAVAAVVVLTALTVQRNRVWADEFIFYKDMVEGAPDSAVPRVNLGSVYFRMGELDKAAIEVRYAVKAAPNNALLRFELGAIYLEKQMHAEALEQLRLAVDIDPAYAEAMNAIGVVYAKQGLVEDAERAFISALSLKPEFIPAARNLEKLKGSLRLD